MILCLVAMKMEENLGFLILFSNFKIVKLKLKLFVLKLEKCQRGILKYLLKIIFIILFAMLVSNVPTMQTVSHVSIFH